MRRLEEALSAILAIDSVDQMSALDEALFAVYGYSGFAYLDIRTLPMSDEPMPFFQATVDQDFINTYVQENYISYDPVVVRAATTNSPFTWADCPEFFEWRQSRRGPKSRSFQVMKSAYDYGFRQGYVIPAHAVDAQGRRASALMTLFWREREEEFGTPESLPPWLRLIGLYYHERLLELRGLSAATLAESPTLSDRERECLCWACRGKTCIESATILGIGERTVEFHIANAMKKLGVHNKFHAIAVAIQRGLIAP